MKTLSRSLFSAFFLPLLAGPALAGRFEDFTSKAKDAPDQAKVLAASYLGGAGTEWLVGGGVRADGSTVLVGVALGPDLVLGGKSARVLGGADFPAPEAAEWPVQRDAKGQPKVDKDGEHKRDLFSWTDPRATAFAAVLGPDFRTVRAVARLPWGAGGATSAVLGPDGAVYLAGPADAGKIAKLKNARALEVPKLETKLAERTLYVAKLSPDAGALEWLHYETGPAEAPEVRVLKDGSIHYRGVAIRNFDPSGKLAATHVVPTGLGKLHSVSPLDGTIARGGEHHWPTGREPWRCPVLDIHEPDGALRYQLYDWGGPLVGLNNLRLVSDSAIRTVTHDDDGRLLLAAWSDGGNSVMYREPFDVRTEAPGFKGLGMSAWGAGVLSCAYLIRLDPTTYRVDAGTVWLSYLTDRDKPNSIWITGLGFAGDGSVALGGKAAASLIQTGNHLVGDGTPGGAYVSVFGKDLDHLRFSSALNACGQAALRNDATFTFASGVANGRHLLLVLTGAAAEDREYNRGAPAPTVNAAQPDFGGGCLDGHFLVLDLGPAR